MELIHSELFYYMEKVFFFLDLWRIYAVQEEQETLWHTSKE